MHSENRLQNGTRQKFRLEKLSRKLNLLGNFDKRTNYEESKVSADRALQFLVAR